MITTVRRGACAAILLLAAAAPAQAQRIKLPYSLEELQRRAVADSLDPAAHYNVALAYWNAKRWEDAEKSLRTAVAIDGKFAEAYLALSYLPYAKRPKLWDEEAEDRIPDEFKAAMEESDRNYRRAFLANPLVDLRISAAAKPPKSALWELFDAEVYDFYFQAFDEMATGSYEQANGRFETYMRERRLAGPGLGKIPMSFLWYHGLAAAHTKRWDMALGKFEELITRSIEQEKKLEDKDLVRIPLRTNEYRYFLANFRQASGQTDAALDLYRQVLTNDIGVYMANVQRANIYEARKQWPEAIAEREGAVNANPDDASLLMDLGVTLAKSGRLAEGEAKLQEAHAANPRDVRILYWLGMVQFEAKKPETKATLERFVALAPARFEPQLALARKRLTLL